MMLRTGKYERLVKALEDFEKDPDDISATDVENSTDDMKGTDTTADSAGAPTVTADAGEAPAADPSPADEPAADAPADAPAEGVTGNEGPSDAGLGDTPAEPTAEGGEGGLAHDEPATVTADLIGAIDAAATVTKDPSEVETSAEQPFGSEADQAAEVAGQQPDPEQVTELSDGTPLEETSVGEGGDTPPSDEPAADAPVDEPAGDVPVEEAGDGAPADAPPAEGGDATAGDEPALADEPSGDDAPAPGASEDGGEPAANVPVDGDVTSADVETDAPNDDDAPLGDNEFEAEDLDDETTEAEADEAQAIAEDIEEEEEDAERQAVSEETTIDDLESDEAALENFKTMLQMGRDRKQYSPQLLMVVANHLDGLKKEFGEYSPKKVPSLEDFTHIATSQSMDEAYGVALESIGGFLARVGGLKKRLVSGVLDYWRKGGLVRKIQSRAEAVKKAADVASQKVNDANPAGPVEIASAPKDLASKSGNLMAGVQTDLKVTSELASQALKANEEALSSIVAIINDAVATGGSGGVDKIKAKIAKLPKVTDKYPKGAFSGDMLGGHQLEHGKGMDDLKFSIPSPTTGKVNRIKDFTLNKADLLNCLKLAKVYAGVAEAIAKTSGVKAAEDIVNANNQRARVNRSAGEMGWSEHSAIDDIMTALPKLIKQHIEVYKFTAGHALDVAEALVALARKAV